MSEYLQSIGIVPEVFAAVVVISSVMFFVFYWRFILNAFDPLVMFVISMVADTILVFALPWEPFLKWEYLFFSLSLWAGFSFASRTRPAPRPFRIRSDDIADLVATLWVLLIIIAVANLYLGVTSGFPLLSANPSEAKVTAMSGGTGLVRRINMGPFLFFACGCVFLAYVNQRRKQAILMLLCSAVFIALGGSKGALLPLLFAQAMLLGHPGLKKSAVFIARMNRLMVITLAAGLLVAIAVTIRDQGGLMSGITSLAQRVLLTGDVVLFYFGGRARVMSVTAQSLAGYLHYLTNDTLAMLRLADYDEPLGSVILGAGNNGFGPNAQYFVRADLFFGPVWGCLYSAIIGFAIGKFRIAFLSSTPSSVFSFVLKLTFAIAAFNLVSESSMFLQIVASIFIGVPPIWGLVRLVRRSQWIEKSRSRMGPLGAVRGLDARVRPN